MIYKCMPAGTGYKRKLVLGFLCSSWSRGSLWCVSEDRSVSCGLSKPSHPQCVVFDVQMRQAFILPEGEVIRAEPTYSRENCEVMCWIDLSNEKLSQSVLPIMDVELDTTGKDSVLERLSTPVISAGNFSPKLFNVVEPSNILENQLTRTGFRDPEWIYKLSLGTGPVCNFLPDTGTSSNIKESHCTFISLKFGYHHTVGK